MLYIPRILIDLGWNRRPLTFDDFERTSDALGVVVQRAPIKTPGMYFVCDRQPFITLSNRICGLHLWLVAWHEMAHHLLHDPGLRCFSPGSVSKAEAEAEAISISAVLDEPTLRRIIGHSELHDLPRAIIKKRLRILSRRGF